MVVDIFDVHFVRWFVRKDDDQRVGVGELDGVAVIGVEPIAAIAQSFWSNHAL